MPIKPAAVPNLLRAVMLVLAAPALPAQQTLLFDDFEGPALNTAIWGVATWNIGDRTQFGNQPTFGSDGTDTWITLPLDTYNPGAPGRLVLGSEIYSLENFPVGGGVEFLARARLNETLGGLVAAFFTYNQQRQKGRWISDEIDFEVLSKQPIGRVLVTSWNDWGAPGSDYEDSVHHAGAYLDLDDYDWRAWNTYAMRWFPDRVEWYVNEALVRTQTSPVPDMDQPVRANLWAGGTTWPEAYDTALQPVSAEGLNSRYEWEIDYILVSRLDGGGGGDPPPAAPGGLAAVVNGKDVNLTWTDNASNETAFTVYRAWMPKGSAAPDFKPVATLGANVTQHADIAVPDGAHLYRVTASNAAGDSQPSNTVNVTVGAGGKGGGKPR